MSGGLYRLDAFGLRSDWNLWRIAHGALDEPELETRRRRRRLYRDDFGDRESLDLALRLFPDICEDLQPPWEKRSDLDVRLS